MKRSILNRRSCGQALALALAACVVSAGAAEHTYQYFRWVPTKLRNNSGANSIQVAEFKFFHNGTQVPWTDVIIENPGGDNPAAEQVTNLIDGNVSTKWLDKNKWGGVVWSFPSATTVDSYQFYTGNDAPDRDPVSWNLEGSSDKNVWTLIDVQRDYPTPATRGGATPSIVIPVTLRPAILSYDASRQIVRNGESTNLSWTVDRAISAEIDHGVGSVDPVAGTTSVNPPAGVDTPYTLTVRSAAGDPDTQSLVVRSVEGGKVQARYIRFTPTATRGSNLIQLAEMRFYDATNNIVAPVEVEDPFGRNAPDAAEGVKKLYDGNADTKWLNDKLSPLIFDFGEEVELSGYRFTTANDAQDRDPMRWFMEASNDRLDWELVENLDTLNYKLPSARKAASQIIPFPGDLVTPIITASIDFSTILPGEEVVLAWDSVGATSVIGDQGLGEIGPGGTLLLHPENTTTYTLTAQSQNGVVNTAQVTIEVVHPAITEIAYDNFDEAGDELSLWRDAAVVEKDGVRRLRVTPDAISRAGAAWFRYKQELAGGFDTTFDFQFTSTRSSGADGMAFVVHNHTATRADTPAAETAENGLPFDAFNVTMDSYINAEDASAALLIVRSGSAEIGRVNLADFPGIPLFSTDQGPDLTDTIGTGAPFHMKISYRAPEDPDADLEDPASSGKLYVWVDDIRVINGWDVTLTDFANGPDDVQCLDEEGKAWVGFTARTGGVSENHDVLNWHLKASSEPIPEKSGFTAWISGFPGLTNASPDADPDGDGISNLMEYVLGGNPTVPSPGIEPRLVVANGALALSYVRRAGLPDVRQFIDYSTDLVTWETLPVQASELVTIEPNTPTTGFERVTVTYPTDEEAEDRFFVRLRAQLAP